jgi:hypothetical protein
LIRFIVGNKNNNKMKDPSDRCMKEKENKVKLGFTYKRQKNRREPTNGATALMRQPLPEPVE